MQKGIIIGCYSDSLETLMGEISDAVRRRAFEAQSQLSRDLQQYDFFKYRLMEAAPKAVHELIEETNVISCIFAFGKWDGHFHDEDSASYGYRDRRHLLSLLRSLRTAWKNDVDIKINQEMGQVGVIFSAAE